MFPPVGGLGGLLAFSPVVLSLPCSLIGQLTPKVSYSDGAIPHRGDLQWQSVHAFHSLSPGGPSAGIHARTAKTCWALRCEAVSASSSVTCYKPWKAYRGRDAATGAHFLTNNPAKAMNSDNPLTLACGNCVGCRLARVEQWAARCYHESQMHEYNSFITLTYDDEYLPDDYSVDKRVWQLFMKRFRKTVSIPIRFFACGEYGEQTLRPHYHAIIFGFAFPDRRFHSTSKGGDKLYSSDLLSQSWPFGLALIGDVTYQSAGYVAGYCMKKVGGDLAASHYLRTHPLTGSPVRVQPEFCLCSRRPGIGASWFEKYKDDAFPSDFLVAEGKMIAVPRYYTLKLSDTEYERVVRLRKLKALPRKGDNTPERLVVRETVRQARISQLKRKL